MFIPSKELPKKLWKQYNNYYPTNPVKNGLIMRSAGLWYTLRDMETGQLYQARLRGKFKKSKGKVTNPLAVGDEVRYEEENKEEGTAIIHEILPRQNYVIRESTHKKTHAHIIAANVDQVLLMATLSLPRTSFGFIDRVLVSTESFGIPTRILFNKKDLLDEESLSFQKGIMEVYEQVGYPCMSMSALYDKDWAAVNKVIKGKKNLIAGHSGVGKSTFLNHLSPNIQQKTSEVSSFANKGVHTTTYAEMFLIDEDTFLIDTPGIKEFGILELEEREVGYFFPEIRKLMNKCKYYNCTHIHEPHCAVKEGVEQKKVAMSRYLSYLSILENKDNRK